MTTPEQQAREMLEKATSSDLPVIVADIIAENTALKAELEAIKQGAGEPVAWVVTSEKQDGTRHTYALMGREKDVRDACDFGEPIPLYPRPCVPLTDEQIYDFVNDVGLDWQSGWTLDECEPNRYVQLARAVEAHIKGAKP